MHTTHFFLHLICTSQFIFHLCLQSLTSVHGNNINKEYRCQHPKHLVNKICVTGRVLSVAETVDNSELVWIGKVLREHKDERLERLVSSNIYTAEIEIYCVLKGLRVASVVNITEAGNVPNKCHRTQLEQGKKYIITAYQAGDHYCPHDDSTIVTDDNIRSISSNCGLDPRYPIGKSELNAVEKCPEILHKTVCPNPSQPSRYNEDDEGSEKAYARSISGKLNISTAQFFFSVFVYMFFFV